MGTFRPLPGDPPAHALEAWLRDRNAYPGELVGHLGRDARFAHDRFDAKEAWLVIERILSEIPQVAGVARRVLRLLEDATCDCGAAYCGFDAAQRVLRIMAQAWAVSRLERDVADEAGSLIRLAQEPCPLPDLSGAGDATSADFATALRRYLERSRAFGRSDVTVTCLLSGDAGGLAIPIRFSAYPGAPPGPLMTWTPAKMSADFRRALAAGWEAGWRTARGDAVPPAGVVWLPLPGPLRGPSLSVPAAAAALALATGRALPSSLAVTGRVASDSVRPVHRISEKIAALEYGVHHWTVALPKGNAREAPWRDDVTLRPLRTVAELAGQIIDPVKAYLERLTHDSPRSLGKAERDLVAKLASSESDRSVVVDCDPPGLARRIATTAVHADIPGTHFLPIPCALEHLSAASLLPALAERLGCDVSEARNVFRMHELGQQKLWLLIYLQPEPRWDLESAWLPGGALHELESVKPPIRLTLISPERPESSLSEVWSRSWPQLEPVEISLRPRVPGLAVLGAADLALWQQSQPDDPIASDISRCIRLEIATGGKRLSVGSALGLRRRHLLLTAGPGAGKTDTLLRAARRRSLANGGRLLVAYGSADAVLAVPEHRAALERWWAGKAMVERWLILDDLDDMPISDDTTRRALRDALLRLVAAGAPGDRVLLTCSDRPDPHLQRLQGDLAAAFEPYRLVLEPTMSIPAWCDSAFLARWYMELQGASKTLANSPASLAAFLPALEAQIWERFEARTGNPRRPIAAALSDLAWWLVDHDRLVVGAAIASRDLDSAKELLACRSVEFLDDSRHELRFRSRVFRNHFAANGLVAGGRPLPDLGELRWAEVVLQLHGRLEDLPAAARHAVLALPQASP